MVVSTFFGEPAKAPGTSCMYHGEDERQEEQKQTTYCQVVNHFLAMYANEDVVGEGEPELQTLRDPNTCLLSDTRIFCANVRYGLVIYMQKHDVKQFLLKDCMSQSDSQQEPVEKHMTTRHCKVQRER